MERQGMDALQERLGYTFNDAALLHQALTTPAYAKQHDVASYERLEYLGDSVAKLAMAQALYDQDMDQDELTKVRNILESNRVLAGRASALGLQAYVISLVTITENDLGVLSDVFEALCGAIYLDSGKNLDVVKDCLIAPILQDKDAIVGDSADQQKNLFIEAVQKVFGVTPIMDMDYMEEGPDHAKRFGCTNLRVMHPADGCILLEFPGLSTDVEFKHKKDAEKDLYKKALDAWKERDFTT
jgi:ribonuclease III